MATATRVSENGLGGDACKTKARGGLAMAESHGCRHVVEGARFRGYSLVTIVLQGLHTIRTTTLEIFNEL